MDFSATRGAANTRRILALWLPRLPTDRLQRKDASLCDAPLAVSIRDGNALQLHAVNRAAQAMGLRRGQPLANARAMVQPLAVVPADVKAEGALLEAMADWCDRFTPFVALDAPDGLLLDITGTDHLFGGEAAMLALVTEKIAAQGFAVAGAIAGTLLAARALARFAHGHVAAPGLEAQSLARLPVAALDCGEAVRRALKRAGLKTIGQVMVRQRSELAARFGKAFAADLDVLLGRHDRPIAPRRALPDLMAERRFAEPLVTTGAIAASLSGLAQSLGSLLEQRGLGLRELEAAFFRADGAVRRITVRLGAPLRDAALLMRLLNEKLEALADPLDPGFGFDLIRLQANLAEAAHNITASFDADENALRQVAFLADRLAARFGAQRVLRFAAQDTHIPEAAGIAIPAQERDITGGGWTLRRGPDDPPLRPLRMLEQAEEVFAVLAAVPDGPPTRFRWRRVMHDVARAEGPERIAMDWWRAPGPGRDYFRVETRQGQRFWLYRDGLLAAAGLASRWYLQGIFA